MNNDGAKDALSMVTTGYKTAEHNITEHNIISRHTNQHDYVESEARG